MKTLYLPLPGKFAAMTVHPKLLILSTENFARLESWRQTMVLKHESMHAAQMITDGWLRFAMRYIFTGYWRAAYEMEANRANLSAWVTEGYIYEDVVQMLVEKVRRAYFPKWWFGTAPSVETMRDILVGNKQPESRHAS
jgi:hypothetical protein